MTDQSDETQKLRERILELEAENKTLRHHVENLGACHEAELDGLLAEIALLEHETSELEESLAVEKSLDFDPEKEQELEDLRTEIVVLVEQLEAERAEAAQGSDEERVYLASNRRKRFHRPNCEWITYVSSYNLIEFCSHKEAVEAGFKPCQTCRA